jgi:hypothetical protein
MKRILLFTLLLAGYPALSQELVYKIPKDATVVASVKGEKLLDLMSIPEFNKSALVQKILKEANRKDGSGSYNKIEDFGVKLNATVYYYNQQTDSISYNCILFAIADLKKFEKKFRTGSQDPITHNGETRTLYNNGDNALLIWNNETACLVFGSLKNHYLEDDSLRAARYGIKKLSYSDYYYDDAVVAVPVEDNDAAVAVDEYAAAVVDSAVAVTDSYYDSYATDTTIAIEPALVEEPYHEDVPMIQEAIAMPQSVDAEVVAEVAAVQPYNNNAYEEAYNEQQQIKKALTKTWVVDFATTTFHKTVPANSILDNPAYLRSLDNNAVASFYLSNAQGLYHGLLPYYAANDYLGNAMEGYGSINAKLFFSKDEIKITSEMEIDDAKEASFKKIFNHKPNKKFARYINSDKVVGFLSYSFDTEQYLKEMPQLLNQSYGRYFGLYHDEIGIGAELFSLLLDEKAVAKVIKGDAILLLNDIGPKEYTYTTYDYDDDYQRTEVKKTKTETLPDFLFIMSSDDTSLLERLLRYGIKKEKISLKNSIYTLDNKITRSNPFSLHILMKDGMIFCGTSYRDIQQISVDNYQGNISKEHKNLLMKNNASMLFNPKNIIGKIPEKELGDYLKMRNFNNLLGSTGQMYARTTGIKNNHISGEMIAKVPAGNENALKYFLSLIDQISKLN